jgi:hypothetical protein
MAISTFYFFYFFNVANLGDLLPIRSFVKIAGRPSFSFVAKWRNFAKKKNITWETLAKGQVGLET